MSNIVLSASQHPSIILVLLLFALYIKTTTFVEPEGEVCQCFMGRTGSLCSEFAAHWPIVRLLLSASQWSEVNQQLSDPIAEEEDVGTSSPHKCSTCFVTPISFRMSCFLGRKLFTCWSDREREGETSYSLCDSFLVLQIQAQKQDGWKKSSQVTWSSSSSSSYTAAMDGKQDRCFRLQWKSWRFWWMYMQSWTKTSFLFLN